MFKLTALLCLTMFVVMLVGGEDRGQLRPGLAMAALQAANSPAPLADTAPEPAVVTAAEPQADVAPVATPVVMQQAPAPVPDAAAPVFSLATFADGATPGDTVVDQPATDGALAYVAGRSVNVREGPGKENAVLTKLARGEAVTVVWQDDTGWTRVRIEGDGIEGYVSSDLLSATAP